MTYMEYRHHVEFGKQEDDEIDRYYKEKEIEWFASAYNIESEKFLWLYNLRYRKLHLQC